MVGIPQAGAPDTVKKGSSNGEETPAEPLVLKMPIGVRSVSLSVLAALALIFLLRYAKELFIPSVLAILIAYALDPLVTSLTRIRIPRVAAATIVVLGLSVGTGYGLYALRHQAVAAVESLPQAAQKLREKIRELQRTSVASTSAIGKIQQAAKELEKAAAEATNDGKTPRGVTKVQIEEPVFRANDYLWSGSLGLLDALSQAVMVAFLVFFILA